MVRYSEYDVHTSPIARLELPAKEEYSPICVSEAASEDSQRFSEYCGKRDKALKEFVEENPYPSSIQRPKRKSGYIGAVRGKKKPSRILYDSGLFCC